MKENNVTPVERIENIILFIRGQKVILDRELAQLYGVTTGNLNKAVKRNLDRFPLDFMFQITREEYTSLRFQIGILEKGRHAKYLPNAFTEQGVAMLSSILNSKRAIQVNIQIMRAFTRELFRGRLKLLNLSILDDMLFEDLKRLHFNETKACLIQEF